MSIVDVLTWVALIAGGVFSVIGAIGVLRFPDFFTRLHAASLMDTLGPMLVLGGLMLQAGFSLATPKLVLILLFLLFTSPTGTHALAKAALHSGLKPWTRETATGSDDAGNH